MGMSREGRWLCIMRRLFRQQGPTLWTLALWCRGGVYLLFLYFGIWWLSISWFFILYSNTLDACTLAQTGATTLAYFDCLCIFVFEAFSIYWFFILYFNTLNTWVQWRAEKGPTRVVCQQRNPSTGRQPHCATGQNHQPQNPTLAAPKWEEDNNGGSKWKRNELGSLKNILAWNSPRVTNLTGLM